MQFSDLPLEVQECFIATLTDDMLITARLVNRSWNLLARRQLFHTITLTPTEQGLARWKNITTSPDLCESIRKVVINSSPVPDYTSVNHSREEYDVKSAWYPQTVSEAVFEADFDIENIDDEDEKHNAQQVLDYYQAVDAVRLFPNVNQITLHFTEGCMGDKENPRWQYGNEDCEDRAYRNSLMKRFFRTIKERRLAGHSPIHTLAIGNLQNDPDSPVPLSSDFKEIMQDIKHYSLEITEEMNHHGPDHDIFEVNRRAFMPVLTDSWLKPFSSHIESLTLGFPDCWGNIPGTFDGSHLSFPKLKHLRLNERSLAHDDSMDWVLAQKSLTSLHLHQCTIPTLILIDEENIRDWNTATHDWQRVENQDEDSVCDTCFTYAGTWAVVFDKIRDGLPDLTDFQFTFNPSNRYPYDSDTFDRRYNHFDVGLLPSQWIDAPEEPRTLADDAASQFYRVMYRNFENDQTDRAALKALMDAIEQRRKRLKSQ